MEDYAKKKGLGKGFLFDICVNNIPSVKWVFFTMEIGQIICNFGYIVFLSCMVLDLVAKSFQKIHLSFKKEIQHNQN